MSAGPMIRLFKTSMACSGSKRKRETRPVALFALSSSMTFALLAMTSLMKGTAASMLGGHQTVVSLPSNGKVPTGQSATPMVLRVTASTSACVFSASSTQLR